MGYSYNNTHTPTFFLIKMNDWCNWATLENDVTKTHGEKTVVRGWVEAVGTNMGLKEPQSKANPLARCYILPTLGSQTLWFMGTKRTLHMVLRLKKVHWLISISYGISLLCPCWYFSSQPNGLRCFHYHHHSPTKSTFKLALRTKE